MCACVCVRARAPVSKSTKLLSDSDSSQNTSWQECSSCFFITYPHICHYGCDHTRNNCSSPVYYNSNGCSYTRTVPVLNIHFCGCTYLLTCQRPPLAVGPLGGALTSRDVRALPYNRCTYFIDKTNLFLRFYCDF